MLLLSISRGYHPLGLPGQVAPTTSPVPALHSILTHKLCLHRNDIARAKIVPRPNVCMTTEQKMFFTNVVKHFLPNESRNLFFGKKKKKKAQFAYFWQNEKWHDVSGLQRDTCSVSLC